MLQMARMRELEEKTRAPSDLIASQHRTSTAKPCRERTSTRKRKQRRQKGHKDTNVRSFRSSKMHRCYRMPSRVVSTCQGQLISVPVHPKCHQVRDLPRILPIIREYQLFRGHAIVAASPLKRTRPERERYADPFRRLSPFGGDAGLTLIACQRHLIVQITC